MGRTAGLMNGARLTAPIEKLVNGKPALVWVRFFDHDQECVHTAAYGRHKRVKKQETIKKQNGLAHLRFLVCVTPKQKKHCLIRESSFQRNMCETANQQYISSHMVVYMACKMR